MMEFLGFYDPQFCIENRVLLLCFVFECFIRPLILSGKMLEISFWVIWIVLESSFHLICQRFYLIPRNVWFLRETSFCKSIHESDFNSC